MEPDSSKVYALAQISPIAIAIALTAGFRIRSTPVFREYIHLLSRRIYPGRFEELIHSPNIIAQRYVFDGKIRCIGQKLRTVPVPLNTREITAIVGCAELTGPWRKIDGAVTTYSGNGLLRPPPC